MKNLFLILFAFIFSFGAYSQSYLGKNKKEIKDIALMAYEDVEIIDETTTSIKMICDDEINEFVIEENICVKFNSIKSYNCNCLDTDVKAYNENLTSAGAMRWISKEGDKLYEIQLKNKEYMISISNNENENLTASNN